MLGAVLELAAQTLGFPLVLKIQSETDQKKRNDMIREAFKIHQDDVGHIPLHHQVIPWAMRSNVSDLEDVQRMADEWTMPRLCPDSCTSTTQSCESL